MNDSEIDGWSLVAGTNAEFCMTAYSALLGRLPDWAAFRYYLNLPIDMETRAQEIGRILDSKEFSRRGLTCAFDPKRGEPAPFDPELRVSAFLTHVLPLLFHAVIEEKKEISSAAEHIGELIREALIDTQAQALADRTMTAPELVAAGEIEALRDRVRKLEARIDALSAPASAGDPDPDQRA